MKLSELAELIGGRLEGPGQADIAGVASLEEALPAEISFVSELRYAAQARQSQAAALIVPADFSAPVAASLVRVSNVEEALDRALEAFAPPADVPAAGIHPTACVAATARLEADVAVGPNAVIAEGVAIGPGSVIAAGCVIGRDVQIGSRCQIGPNVVIAQRCIVGNGVIIHANSSIGADGFGYRLVAGRQRKIPHVGIVVIEDEVEIGSNSCVDRAKFGRTIIGRGTKIDNLVQIAHNVHIGAHSIIVAQTGIAGSARLGQYVVLGGQCGVRDHVRIGDRVMVGATSAVYHDIEAGAKVAGTPAQPAREFFRQLALIKKLPDMERQIKQLRTAAGKDAQTEDHSSAGGT